MSTSNKIILLYLILFSEPYGMMPPGMDPSFLFRSPLFSDAENNNLMAAAAAAEKARAMMMMTGRPPHPALAPIGSPMGHPGAGQLFPGAALAAALAASSSGAPVPPLGLVPPPLSQANQLSLPAPPAISTSKNGNISPPGIGINQSSSKVPSMETNSSVPPHPPTSLPQLYTLNSSRENPLPLPLPPALFSQWSAVHQAAAAHQAMIAHQANLISTSPSTTTSLPTLGRGSSPPRIISASPNIITSSPSSSPTIPKISSGIVNSPAGPLGISALLQQSSSSSVGSPVAAGIAGTADIRLPRPVFPTAAAALGITQRFTPYVIPPKRSTPSPNRISPMSDQRSSPASASGSTSAVNGACNFSGTPQALIRSPSLSPTSTSASPARS